MARKPRIKAPGYAAAYHLISRTAGAEYWLDNHMKQTFIRKLVTLKELYFVQYPSFSSMTNHTHIMVVFKDPSDIDERDAMERWNRYHEKEYKLNPNVEAYRKYVVRELTDVLGAYRKAGSDTVMSSGQSDARLGDEIHAGGPSSRSRNEADGCLQP